MEDLIGKFLQKTLEEKNGKTIEEKFETIAKGLINNFYINCDNKDYYFAEIEFYYYDKVNFNEKWNRETYPRTDKEAGDLFFHYSGCDICFKSVINEEINDVKFGGILIRSLYDKVIDKYITGPTVCANEILNSCSKSRRMPDIKYKEQVYNCEVKSIERYGITQYENEELCFYDSRLPNRCSNKFENIKWDFDKKNDGKNPKLTDYTRTYSRFNKSNK